MDRLVHGKATVDEWSEVSLALNVAAALSEMGIGAEYEAVIRKAMVSHALCGRRLHKLGRLGYSGPELQDVNDAIAVHEAQLDVATVAELEQANEMVQASIRNKRFYISATQEGKYEGDRVRSQEQASFPFVGTRQPGEADGRAVGREPEVTSE